MKTLIAILFAIAFCLQLTGCESTTAISTPHGINITLDGKPIFIHPGAKIVTRDPKTGRFVSVRVIEP